MQPARRSCCAPAAPREETTRDDVPSPLCAGDRTGQLRGMVRLSGGAFVMGCDDPEGFEEDGEGPVREVLLSPYLMDEKVVTTRDFGAFVQETGFVTDAERLG